MEHSLPGTGSVYEYLVKKACKIPLQNLRVLACHIDIGNACHLQILKQSLCPAAADVVGQKHSLSHKPSAQLRGFTARSRAQIQYAVSRFYRKPAGRCHSAWLLQIIQSGKIIRMPGCPLLLLQKIPVWYPGYLLHGKGGDGFKFFAGNLCCVDTESLHDRQVKALFIGLQLRAQQFFHLLFIITRQIHCLVLFT